MADTTDVLALPYPEGADANDVPADMQALAERLDEAPGIESLTSAEISALAAGLKPAGRVVFNSTTSKLQVSNGTSFADVADATKVPLAGGTMTGTLTLSGAPSGDNDAATKAYADAAQHYVTGLQSGQTLTAASDITLTYTSETDPGGILNAGTGIVTIPAKGLYTVSGGLAFSSNTATDIFRRLRVVIDGSVVAEQSNVTYSGALNVTWTGVLDVNALVKLDHFHDNYTLTGAAWLAVAFIGAVA